MADERPNPIRILVLDDHALLREALSKTLSAEPDLAVIGGCAGIVEALACIARTKVDVVLLDINLGPEQGTGFVGRAKAQGYSGKILVVTAGVTDREAVKLLSHGCSGIFNKSEPLPNLIAQVRRIIHEDGLPRAVEPFGAATESLGPGLRKPLTSREKQVLRHVCDGLANKEIAQLMGVSEHSVKSFVQQLFSKTGTRSRTQLVAFAIEEYWEQLEH